MSGWRGGTITNTYQKDLQLRRLHPPLAGHGLPDNRQATLLPQRLHRKTDIPPGISTVQAHLPGYRQLSRENTCYQSGAEHHHAETGSLAKSTIAAQEIALRSPVQNSEKSSQWHYYQNHTG